jgi:hypothetical protein
MAMTKNHMTTLAAAELDIDELERRLELAAPATQGQSWTPPPTCPYDCPMVCHVDAVAGGQTP